MIFYGVSYFAGSSSVLFYSAINIMYILMPVAAIAGFKFAFARGGLLRRRARSSSRIFFIVICAITLFLSPLSFVQFFAVFGSGYVLWKALFLAIIEKNKKNGENEDRQ